MTNCSSLDEQRRKSLAEVEALKSLRNRVSKEIGALMGQKKLAEAEAKKAETRNLGDQIAGLDKQAAAAEAARDALMLQLPNLPHESVPLGKSAEDNPVVRVLGEKIDIRPSSPNRTSNCANHSSWSISPAPRSFRAAASCSIPTGAQGWSGP